MRFPWTKCLVEMPKVKEPVKKKVFPFDDELPIRAIQYHGSNDRNYILQFKGSDGKWKSIKNVIIDRETGKEIITNE